MSLDNLGAIVGFCAGIVLGYLVTSNHYQDKMLGEVAIYKEQVQEARAKEREWQQLANNLDNDYKAKIDSIQSSNDELVTRLRQQLLSASRVSSDCKSSEQSDVLSRKARISEEVGNIVTFSQQCAERADKLIIQINSLQEWIRKMQ